MRPAQTLYPALSRYFDSTTDMANACCMKRNKLYKCLKGEQEFTPQEKDAIVANIIARMYGELSQEEQTIMIDAFFNRHFDQHFKITTEVNK